jgi:hypothetical protein
MGAFMGGCIKLQTINMGEASVSMNRKKFTGTKKIPSFTRQCENLWKFAAFYISFYDILIQATFQKHHKPFNKPSF